MLKRGDVMKTKLAWATELIKATLLDCSLDDQREALDQIVEAVRKNEAAHCQKIGAALNEILVPSKPASLAS